MLLAIASLLLSLSAAPPADVTGKWDGKLTGQRADGTTSENSALLILDQKDTTITGTIGGSDADQHPITSGTIEGNKVTIVAKREDGRELRLDLTLEKDELKGTITSGERKGQVEARRRKE